MTEIFYFIHFSASLAIVCLARPGALSYCAVVRGCLAHYRMAIIACETKNCFVSAWETTDNTSGQRIVGIFAIAIFVDFRELRRQTHGLGTIPKTFF